MYAVYEIHKTTFGGCEQELFLTKGPCSLGEYAISLWWIPKIMSGNLGWTGLMSRWLEYCHVVFSSLKCYTEHCSVLFHLCKMKTKQIMSLYHDCHRIHRVKLLPTKTSGCSPSEDGALKNGISVEIRCQIPVVAL